MKRLLLPLLLVCIGLSFESKACIDPGPDTTIKIIVNYDTVFVSPCVYADEIEIRLSNLRMMNESPNKICACGLSQFATLFSVLRYVAFVDSGTNNPYNGFDPFTLTSGATDAWATSQPSFGGWSGFISDVINGGLNATEPVEMIIRAEALPNTVINIDTNCGSQLEAIVRLTALGTDAWDPVLNDLDQSHQEVRTFDDILDNPYNTGQVFQMKPSSYFTDLDDDILDNYPTDTNSCLAMFTADSIGPLTYAFTDMSNMDGNQYIEWDFDDGSAPVKAYAGSSIEHSFSASGLYDVCLRNYNNGSVCDVFCGPTVVGSPNGVATVSKEATLITYPNPAKDQLQLKVSNGFGAIERIILYSLDGKLVAEWNNPTYAIIDTRTLYDGMYHITVVNAEGVSISKMVIVNN